MTAYEISNRLAELGYDGDNSTQTSSMMHLMDACEAFGVPFSIEDHQQCSLQGHVGWYREGPNRSVWFILLDREEREQHPGASVTYSLHFDPGYPNGEIITRIYR